MAAPKVSIVVPVYNVEPYLRQCFDSLIGQTLPDIEIVAVDDGSTDGSPAILREYSERDSRIRVVTQENAGLSQARNVGIENASGAVLVFVDPDDFVDRDTCEVVWNAFARAAEAGRPLDVLTFGGRCFPEEYADPWIQEHLSPRDALFEGFSPQLLFEEMSSPYAVRMAVDRAFLEKNGIRFDSQCDCGEDEVFAFALYPQANRVQLSSRKLYNYRMKRPGSLTGEALRTPSEKVQKHIQAANRVFAEADRLGYLQSQAAELLRWLVEYVGLQALLLEPSERDEACNAVRELASRCRAFGYSGVGWGTALVLRVLSKRHVTEADALVARLAYRVQEKGWGSLVEAVGRKLRGC